MKTLIEDFDTKFYICVSCDKHYEPDKAKLITNSEIKPGSYLGERLMERDWVKAYCCLRNFAGAYHGYEFESLTIRFANRGVPP